MGQGGFDFPPGRAPYPGFLSFDEADAAIYFGRDDDVRRLIQRADSRRIEGGRRCIFVLGIAVQQHELRTPRHRHARGHAGVDAVALCFGIHVEQALLVSLGSFQRRLCNFQHRDGGALRLGMHAQHGLQSEAGKMDGSMHGT